jgi:sugar lactone lactonase YvrE
MLIFVSGLTAGSAAADVPPCSGPVSKSTLYSDLGKLESVIVGNAGRIYVSLTPTDSTASRLITISRPGKAPRTVSDGPGGPGGLSWQKKRLLWGYGNSAENGETGDENPVSGLYRVNLNTGSKSVVSDHLGMANGVARAKNGAIYASNDFGMKLDRITPSGSTVNGWATVESPNGLVLSKNQKYLFAAQTFAQPSAIARIKISDPGTVKTWATTEGLITGNPIFDGLARDNKGSLYVAAWAAGEVWKIDSERRFCVLATDLGRPSALAFGKGKKGFRSGRLYTVGFNGELAEIKGAVAATYPVADAGLAPADGLARNLG